MVDRGLLVVLSGPAGSGKTTLARHLAKRNPEIARAVTATTRLPRQGEVEGRDYYFLPRGEFAAGIAGGRFVEHAEFGGNLYGTPRDELERLLAAGRIVLLVIDVQGAAQIRSHFPQAVSVFVLPPSPAALEQRLRDRGTESEREVAKRLAIAQKEIVELENYDFLVINADLQSATEELLTLMAFARAHRVRGGEHRAWLAGEYADARQDSR